jgi:alpha-L-fucosidase
MERERTTIGKVAAARMKTSLPVLALVVISHALAGFAIAKPADTLVPNDSAEQARMAWWRDAKFGLFMHWGVYSIPGRGEWVQWNEQIPVGEYAKLADKFNPDKFDPDAWATAANAAGMKYTVLTARHHDGFALFNDPGSDFTAMKSAAHRDFIADYVKAVRKAGLKVGLYYSPLDWRFPGFFFPDIYRANAEQLRDQYHRQLNELASNYGQIDLLWFDGGGVDWLGFNGVTFKGGWHARPAGTHYTGTFSWKDDQAVGNLRKLQPGIICNNRTDAPADFISREGDAALGDFDNQHPWELCTTLAGSWGYTPKYKIKPLEDCIRLLVNTVGRDGNLLLNVGPRADGQIEPDQVQRLHEIGDWLKQYGQSIYATRGGPYLPGDFGVSTCRDKTIYLHVLKSPLTSITLPALPVKVLNCQCLTGGDAACKQTDQSLEIVFTGSTPGVDTIVALRVASQVNAIQPIAVPK